MTYLFIGLTIVLAMISGILIGTGAANQPHQIALMIAATIAPIAGIVTECRLFPRQR